MVVSSCLAATIFGISKCSKDTKNLGVGNVLNTNKRYTYILKIPKNFGHTKIDMLEVFKDAKLR